MQEDKEIKAESPAVQAHLAIMQSVIQRMAANSASSKAWCIGLVSAILVIVADKGKPNYALLALIPTTLFLVLDAYYLALERGFRAAYNSFVKKLHEGKVVAEDVYWVTPEGPLWKKWVCALGSFSIWPFYIALFAMIWLAKELVIG
ncbi:hypothetical protein [Thermus islandicus]|uniref:hypothetical protein n=1 Tax=Thermus islandicus TaxID=540988 RepID=UPI0009FEE7D3|nr:hypothetical protein [Thermus islandicus]